MCAMQGEIVDDEDEGREVASLDGGGALSAMTRSEIDMQVATAKKYPRDVVSAVKKMETMACMDEETAASCFYTLPRGGKTIQGESIRLAEIAIACYGNVRAGTRVVAIDAESDTPNVTVQAAFHDVENNVMVTIEKRRRITKKKGKAKPDEDDIQLATDSGQSLALRVATFRVIPKSLVRKVYLQCKRVAVGDASTLVNKRADVVARLQKMGPTVERIFAVVDAKRIEDIDLEKLELLIGLGTAIKDGNISADVAFPEIPTAGGKVGESDANAKFGSGKKTETEQPGNAEAAQQGPADNTAPAGDDNAYQEWEAKIGDSQDDQQLNVIETGFQNDKRLSPAQRDMLGGVSVKQRRGFDDAKKSKKKPGEQGTLVD
jgi:hypothetical protein